MGPRGTAEDEMGKRITVERVVQHGVKCSGTDCGNHAQVRVAWRTEAMPASAFDYWCSECWQKVRARMPRMSAVAYAVCK